MKLADFARSRGVEPKTVSIYMQRHGMDYDRERGLTAEQERELDGKYPLPQPIQVVEDTESKNALIKAQQEIIDLTKQLAQARERAIEAQATEYQLHLLEDAHKEQASKLQKAEAQIEADKLTLDDRQAQINILHEQIHRMQHRTLWQRITNKEV